MFLRTTDIAYLILLLCCACFGETQHRGVTVDKYTLESCRQFHAPSCGQLADVYRQAGKKREAWAFVEFACATSNASACVSAWRRHQDIAPSRTAALMLLDGACFDKPAACSELARWHQQRGHLEAARNYDAMTPDSRERNAESKRDDQQLEADRVRMKAESDAWAQCHIHGNCGLTPHRDSTSTTTTTTNHDSKSTNTRSSQPPTKTPAKCPGATKPSSCTGRVCACVAQD